MINQVVVRVLNWPGHATKIAGGIARSNTDARPPAMIWLFIMVMLMAWLREAPPDPTINPIPMDLTEIVLPAMRVSWKIRSDSLVSISRIDVSS